MNKICLDSFEIGYLIGCLMVVDLCPTISKEEREKNSKVINKLKLLALEVRKSEVA